MSDALRKAEIMRRLEKLESTVLARPSDVLFADAIGADRYVADGKVYTEAELQEYARRAKCATLIIDDITDFT